MQTAAKITADFSMANPTRRRWRAVTMPDAWKYEVNAKLHAAEIAAR
jgi:hypothetical protein